MEPLDKQSIILVTNNLDYVKKIAHKYEGKGVAYEELLSEAHEELCRCAIRFDPEKGASFITYLTIRINGALENLLDSSKPHYKENKRKRYVETLSLDYIYNVDEDEEVSLAEMIPDIEVEDEDRELVDRLLVILNEDEKELISKKFCLDGDKNGFKKLRKSKYAQLSDTQLRRRYRKAMEKLRAYAKEIEKEK